MNEVKRFDITCEYAGTIGCDGENCHPTEAEDKDGGYVKHEDYAKVEERLAMPESTAVRRLLACEGANILLQEQCVALDAENARLRAVVEAAEAYYKKPRLNTETDLHHALKKADYLKIHIPNQPSLYAENAMLREVVEKTRNYRKALEGYGSHGVVVAEKALDEALKALVEDK